MMLDYTKIHLKIAAVVIALGALIIFTSMKIESKKEVDAMRVAIEGLKPKKSVKSVTITAEISAYTSRRAETDDTPCINAWGDNICNLHKAGFRIIACPSRFNRLDLVEIDGKAYRCLDRMNARYRDGDFFDIYFGKDVKGARQFGRKSRRIAVYHQG